MFLEQKNVQPSPETKRNETVDKVKQEVSQTVRAIIRPHKERAKNYHRGEAFCSHNYVGERERKHEITYSYIVMSSAGTLGEMYSQEESRLHSAYVRVPWV